MPEAYPLATRKEMLHRIIDALVDDVPLRAAVKQQGISTRSFQRWIAEDKEASRLYAHALEFRADLMVEDAMALADGDGDPAKVRNQIEIRKWIATKQHSKRYGERIDLNVSQTIDVGSTLAEARARMLRPVRDQQDVIDAEIVNSPSVAIAGPFDKQSTRPRFEDVPAPGAEPDIFS